MNNQTATFDFRDIALNIGPFVELNGNRYEADHTKAYTTFKLNYGFPVITTHGTTIHPSVVDRASQSMVHQVLNVGHRMRQYDPKNNSRDWIIGAIVDVSFPRAPFGGWKIQSLQDTPGMTCVASIFKMAEKSQTVLGEHLTSRRSWTVSTEMLWLPDESGVVVHADSLNACGVPDGNPDTPSDMIELGWHYFSNDAFPELFKQVYNPKEAGLAGKYRKEKCAIMLGGLDGNTHFSGVGMVLHGAEPTAKVEQMVASDDEKEAVNEFAEEVLEAGRALLNM